MAHILLNGTGLHSVWANVLLPVVKLNEVSQPTSIECETVHDFNQAVFGTYNFENLANLDFASIQLCIRTCLRC